MSKSSTGRVVPDERLLRECSDVERPVSKAVLRAPMRNVSPTGKRLPTKADERSRLALVELLKVVKAASVSAETGIAEPDISDMGRGGRKVQDIILRSDAVQADPRVALVALQVLAEQIREAGGGHYTVQRRRTVSHAQLVAAVFLRALERGLLDDWMPWLTVVLGTDEEGVKLAIPVDDGEAA